MVPWREGFVRVRGARGRNPVEMRIPNLDLDFFVNDVAHLPKSGERLDPERFKPGQIDEGADMRFTDPST